MMTHSSRYSRMPGKEKEKNVSRAYPARTRVGSTSKKSAMPPHTPASIRSEDFVSFLYITITFK